MLQYIQVENMERKVMDAITTFDELLQETFGTILQRA